MKECVSLSEVGGLNRGEVKVGCNRKLGRLQRLGASGFELEVQQGPRRSWHQGLYCPVASHDRVVLEKVSIGGFREKCTDCAHRSTGAEQRQCTL